jgi:hypothetical protein
MEMNEMINILNGMCERCLMKGLLPTLIEAKTLCDTFDRFRNRNYMNDDEYSRDVLYFYNLAVKLHDSGYTSLGESYSIYNAILFADSVDFVESNNSADVESITTESPKHKRSKKSKENNGEVNISDIIIS